MKNNVQKYILVKNVVLKKGTVKWKIHLLQNCWFITRLCWNSSKLFTQRTIALQRPPPDTHANCYGVKSCFHSALDSCCMLTRCKMGPIESNTAPYCFHLGLFCNKGAVVISSGNHLSLNSPSLSSSHSSSCLGQTSSSTVCWEEIPEWISLFCTKNLNPRSPSYMHVCMDTQEYHANENLVTGVFLFSMIASTSWS